MFDFKFPVFYITNRNTVYTDNGITYVDILDTSETKIIDNKNLLGDNLAIRRLQIANNLFPLKKVRLTFAQLIKKHIAGNIYIDNFGKVFKYKKSVVVPLIYRKIISAKAISGYGYALTIQGISAIISIPAGCDTFGYVGLLKWQGGYILYDISTHRKPDTWRKI